MPKKRNSNKHSRRDFLKIAGTAGLGAAATIALAENAQAQPVAGEGAGAPAWTMVIDLKKCTGCRGCVIACKSENHTPPGVAYSIVMDDEPEAQGLPFIFRPCMQCKKSSCVMVCPTSATHLRSDGIIAIDYDKCIGCKYCLTACPYNARSFDFGEYYNDGDNSPKFDGATEVDTYEDTASPEYNQNRIRRAHRSPIGNARKCTFCLHRIYGPDGKPSGMNAACADACIGRAIHFGNLNDPGDLIHELLNSNRGKLKLKEALGNEPTVVYLI